MAEIFILPSSLTVEGGQMRITGIARVSPGSDEILWDATVAWAATAAQISTAIKDAAVAAAAAAGFTVGALDNKVLIAGAVVL